MWLPRSEADPAKICLARLIFAHHVVASTILFDGRTAGRALFGVGRYPVGRLRVVVTLFDPLLDEMTSHWIVPILRAGKAECMSTQALDGLGLNMGDFDGMGAIGS